MVVRPARQQPADQRHGSARQPQQAGNWSHEMAISIHATVIGTDRVKLKGVRPPS
jgi:hypothetical protein